MRQMISSSIDVVIQLVRLSDGVRRMSAMSEITGMESGVISMQDIFVFERQGIDEQGKISGRFAPTGVRPRFVERCRANPARRCRMAFFCRQSDPWDASSTIQPSRRRRLWISYQTSTWLGWNSTMLSGLRGSMPGDNSFDYRH